MEATPQQAAEGLAIVKILAAVLDRLVCTNASHAQTDPGQISKFHALKAPGIGIQQYLERIHRYASCSNECFILALIYIDRLIQRNNFLLTELNVHRVVITAILLAAKFFDDAYYNNAYYSKVGGVLVSEMNGLEVDFLFRINFSLHVTPDVFKKYKDELLSHCVAAGIQPQQLQQVREDIAPATQQQVIHAVQLTTRTPVPPPAVTASQFQTRQIPCPSGMAVQPPAPSQITPSSSHSTPSASNIRSQHQLQKQPPTAMYDGHENIVSHNSSTTVAAVAAAAADMYFPNNFQHNPLLQRANSMPVQAGPQRCALNPPFSAPMVPMMTNTIDNDSFLVVDNQIYPIQNALIHHHHGLKQYQESTAFQVQQDGAYHQINRDSLVAGHY
uniref:Cyclin n=1 Tax=Craspedostauros australis TaxID=1486917 RepID=A0A6T6F4E0_9STRA|mmetsp:Transcript_14552/g.40135  ORF Transcript_14552/g.40135 Transcript_14552/m.40135 type:complete len:387 (+) Transcript_14552:324-1484(+)|eukprot:CAMPEP_0198120284 /NCGR_PEP_ID=MMETSP1442-20131203/28506_1 /TAXON_ID= /ORGANISM="Craspedostauros australis, Strain CCMP3328" /LENGTH=386 /DNA_ID=CAMNT_0043778905 /DNA_START=909 /DNA_END=2069 /DNA_ORIENTATION=+